MVPHLVRANIRLGDVKHWHTPQKYARQEPQGGVLNTWLKAHSDGATLMREKIKLVSSAGTGYFYTTMKNKRKTPDKLRLRKYDPKIRQHVEFVEAKIK